MTAVAGWVGLGAVVAIYLLGIVLVVWPFRAWREAAGPATNTRILLVLLRLVIAWHFFIEGTDKLHHAEWTSENYLRESTGPLAPVFRDLAGDRLVERLTLGSDKSFPDELDLDWDAYLNAVAGYYELDDEQIARARMHLEQTKKNIEMLLSTRKKDVEKPSIYPPTITLTLTMPERLVEYAKVKGRVQEIESKLLLPYGGDVVEEWKTAKGHAGKWRAGLQRDLVHVNNEMKRTVQTVLLDFVGQKLPPELNKKLQERLAKPRADATKEVGAANPYSWDDIDRLNNKWARMIADGYHQVLAPMPNVDDPLKKEKIEASQDPLTRKVFDTILERPKGAPTVDPLPYPASRSITQWPLIEWSDRIVKFGLLGVGFLLLIGLFTRTACVVGATFLLLFYLAMPALPGWPDSPRSEGHYLFVNKNLIEMLALFALATTQNGRWAGLDALVCFLCPSRWRKDSVPATMEKTELKPLP